MTDPDDEIVELLLAGRVPPGAEEWAATADAVGALRAAAADEPVPPVHATLAALLAPAAPADSDAAGPRHARGRNRPAQRGARVRRLRRVSAGLAIGALFVTDVAAASTFRRTIVAAVRAVVPSHDRSGDEPTGRSPAHGGSRRPRTVAPAAPRPSTSGPADRPGATAHHGGGAPPTVPVDTTAAPARTPEKSARPADGNGRHPTNPNAGPGNNNAGGSSTKPATPDPGNGRATTNPSAGGNNAGSNSAGGNNAGNNAGGNNAAADRQRGASAPATPSPDAQDPPSRP